MSHFTSCPGKSEQYTTYINSVNKVLLARPLAPSNINMFSPAAYPDATPMVPAAGPPPTTMQVQQMLKTYLQEEFPSNQKARKKAMALFNSPEAIAKIPNPSLRAAMVGLIGTGGEPSINYIMNEKTPEGLPKVNLVGFGVPEEWVNDPAAARPILDPNTQQVFYVFNPKYESENPFQLSSILGHETLHTNLELQSSTTEEVIALALHISIYLEQLAKHPEMALADTELTRRNNTNALARLNSGEGTKLGLYTSNHPDEQILPGSVVPATTWFEQFQHLPGFEDTPGSPLLRKFLKEIAKPGTAVPPNPNFDMATLDFIDQNSHNLDRKELVKAARALRLDLNV